MWFWPRFVAFWASRHICYPLRLDINIFLKRWPLQMFYIIFVPNSSNWYIFQFMTKFIIWTPFWVIYWLLSVILHSLRLNIIFFKHMGCFKCFLKGLYNFFFRFYPFLDFKMTHFPIYCHSLRLNINILKNMGCFKCFLQSVSTSLFSNF